MRSVAETGQGTASAAALALQIEEYLAEYPGAAILEDGRVLFDLRHARYSIADSHGRCVWQLWSEERNVVRSVIATERRASCLRVMTRRLGAAKPTSLDVVPGNDRRTPTTRDAQRRQYLRLLERVIERRWPEGKVDGFRAASDLEHSFGPAYVRGCLLQGPRAEAVIGIGSEESSALIDGILTVGLLWLDHCRQRSLTKSAGKSKRGESSRHFNGLTVVVPEGAWRTTAERMAWLNQGAAAFQLFTLNERSEELTEVDFHDTGNVESRLVHAFDVTAARERAASSLERVMALVSEPERRRVEVRVHSATEVGLLLHGLEFARVRRGASSRSFAAKEQITFGAGSNETPLTPQTELLCRQLLGRLFENRHPDGTHVNPLFRLQPERWLESRIRMGLAEFLPGLRGDFLYSQVPAIGSGERGMLDLLTVDREGRLVVIEVKADDDMHLPLQGLDYWIRVRALNADRKREGNRENGAFERQGYFSGVEVAEKPPRLLLIAPALRIHPSNETVLRYLSPQVDWELIAVGEHWRQDLKVVFRKRNAVP